MIRKLISSVANYHVDVTAEVMDLNPVHINMLETPIPFWQYVCDCFLNIFDVQHQTHNYICVYHIVM